MLVAAGQFAVTYVWEKNAEICASLMAQAAENDVSLFVLPEALLARDDHDADLSVKSAQLLEGEFLGRLPVSYTHLLKTDATSRIVPQPVESDNGDHS